MFLLNKKEFENAYAIMKKEKVMEPVFLELKKFVENEYKLTVFNIRYEKIPNSFFNKPLKNSYFYGKKYKLIFEVASINDREAMQYRVPVKVDNFSNAYKMINDEQKQNEILNKFFELAKILNYPTYYNKEDIWVDYYFSFPIDYLNLIIGKIESRLKREVLNKYKEKANIWEIVNCGFGIHILYFTELNKNENEQNGITESIKNIYLSTIKEMDEFDFYKKEYIHFDTKENIDTNYEGSIYYYLR